MSTTNTLILGLTTLLVVGTDSAVKQTIAKISECASAMLTSRRLLEDPVVTSSKVECVSLCARDDLCQLAVWQVFDDGQNTCSLYTVPGNALGTVWNATNVQECSSIYLATTSTPCQNGGQWKDEICLCTSQYTGLHCEMPNQPYCNNFGKWGDVYTIDGDVRPTLSPILAANDTFLKSWKIGYNDTDLEISTVYQTDSIIVYSATSSFEVYSLISAGRAAWDRFNPDADRLLRMFSFTNGHVKLTTVSTDANDQSKTVSAESSSFFLMLPEETRFQIAADFVGVSQEVILRDHLENGYEPHDISTVKYVSSTSMFQSAFKHLRVDEVAQIADWHLFKFGLQTNVYHLYSPIVARGLMNSGSATSSDIQKLFFNPCWRELGDGVDLETGEPYNQLISYIRNGHRFRLYQVTDEIFTGVIDVMRIQDKVHFFLEQMDSDKSTGVYTVSNTFDTKTLVTLPDTVQKCARRIESELVIGMNDRDNLSLKVFLDTRTWIKVYQVFSISSESHGQISDLAKAVLDGRDVNVLVEWPSLDTDELFQTHLNSVNRDGQVSSESVTLCNHSPVASPPFRFGTKCGLRKILASSEGRLEIMEYDLFTPGTITVESDVIITWFVN